jgi:hypothetical protein
MNPAKSMFGIPRFRVTKQRCPQRGECDNDFQAGSKMHGEPCRVAPLSKRCRREAIPCAHLLPAWASFTALCFLSERPCVSRVRSPRRAKLISVYIHDLTTGKTCGRSSAAPSHNSVCRADENGANGGSCNVQKLVPEDSMAAGEEVS